MLQGEALSAERARGATLRKVPVSSREKGDIIMLGIGGRSGTCTSSPSASSLATMTRDMMAKPRPVATSPLIASGLPSSTTVFIVSGGTPASCR